MREPTFLILTALAGEPLHGYGILRQVEALSAERVSLSAGTLYAALDRLAGEGLIEASGEEEVDGRVRRYYRLTPDGGAALDREAEALRRNADLASARLAAWRPHPA